MVATSNSGRGEFWAKTAAAPATIKKTLVVTFMFISLNLDA
jgi:hypothetical protein